MVGVINNVVRDPTLDYVNQWRLAIRDIDNLGESFQPHPYLKQQMGLFGHRFTNACYLFTIR